MTEQPPVTAEERDTVDRDTDRDTMARLAARGEQTLARLAELPGGSKALNAMNDLRNRVDELGKKVRGIDELERRVAALEAEVAALKGVDAGAGAAPPTA